MKHTHTWTLGTSACVCVCVCVCVCLLFQSHRTAISALINFSCRCLLQPCAGAEEGAASRHRRLMMV